MMATLLAGCSDDGGGTDATPDDAGPGAGDPAATGDEPLEVPEWNVGSFWTFSSSGPGGIGTYTLAVGESTGSDYVIGTDHDALAFFDATDPISTMGPQRKSDLAGSQGTTRVEFFKWPLEDGKTWSTTWDGEVHEITANRTSEREFSFTATVGGETRIQYAYDHSVKWFTEMRFFANGTEFFTSTIQEWGGGYSGELIRYTVEPLAGGPIAAPAGQAQWSVGPGFTDVWIGYGYQCSGMGVAAVAFGPVPPTDAAQAHYEYAQCPTAVQNAFVLPPTEGTWGLAFVGEDQNQSSGFGFNAMGRIRETYAPA